MEIQKQKKVHLQVHRMLFTLFIVVFIFGFCQSLRCVGNIADAYVINKYADCIYNYDPDYSHGIPAWSFLLHSITRVFILVNR